MVILREVRFLNFFDRMSVAKVMRSSTLALLILLAAARACETAEVRIHWTVPSIFHFLAHPQIMHCVKDITRKRTFTRVTHASEHVGKKIINKLSLAKDLLKISFCYV